MMATPLTVSYDAETDVLTINGLKYLGEVFRNFASPHAYEFYRLIRKDDLAIIVPASLNAEQARGQAWGTAFDNALSNTDD